MDEGEQLERHLAFLDNGDTEEEEEEEEEKEKRRRSQKIDVCFPYFVLLQT